ncbi:hypothetical protein Dda_4771 [Drechslerella dactyloides]|uniref:Uncharacterized protein n=1 Tax=Drechslerella dactyloides TaxID=74499 RepID=A0AAD6NJP0_DREDA|nr:hypothetical protein Dda_4771 [Drechslerella dactyloides]
MTFTTSLPKPFAHNEEMRSSVVVSLYRRINDLNSNLGLQKSEATKVTEQIDEIKAWAKKAQSQIEEGQNHCKLSLAAFDKLHKSFSVIDRLIGTPADGIRSENAVPAAVTPVIPILAEAQGVTPAAASKAPSVTEIGGSEFQSAPPSPTQNLPIPVFEPEPVDLAELYSYVADPDSRRRPNGFEAPLPGESKPQNVQYTFQDKRKGTPAHGTVNAAPTAPAQAAPKRAKLAVDVFAADDAAVMASYQARPSHLAPQSQASTRATSDHSSATVIPSKPAAAGGNTQALANMIGGRLETAITSTLSTPVTTLITRIPDNFNHRGSLPGQVGTLIGEAYLCARSAYDPQRVPVIRLCNIPASVSIEDILAGVAGGPLYRVQLNPIDEKAKTRNIRLTFIHREHALAFLRFAQGHKGLLIKGVPNRIEVVIDQTESEHRISYSTFRKIVTENCTRMVYLKGLDRRFWTPQKVRQLVVTCVERVRVEDPRRYRFKDPCHITDDILTCKIGVGDSGALEALIGMRSIAWGLMVKSALNGLKEPEGFYAERVQGELGPSIQVYDAARANSVVTAFWGRDACDVDVSKLPT